jgi:hypothetical protein
LRNLKYERMYRREYLPYFRKCLAVLITSKNKTTAERNV